MWLLLITFHRPDAIVDWRKHHRGTKYAIKLLVQSAVTEPQDIFLRPAPNKIIGSSLNWDNLFYMSWSYCWSVHWGHSWWQKKKNKKKTWNVLSSRCSMIWYGVVYSSTDVIYWYLKCPSSPFMEKVLNFFFFSADPHGMSKLKPCPFPQMLVQRSWSVLLWLGAALQSKDISM